MPILVHGFFAFWCIVLRNLYSRNVLENGQVFEHCVKYVYKDRVVMGTPIVLYKGLCQLNQLVIIFKWFFWVLINF